MNRKTQRGKHFLKKQGGGNTMQRALAWLLVVVIVLDGISVPEKTGMVAQAAEPVVEAEAVSAEGPAEKYDSSEENYSLEETYSLEENFSSWDAADVSAGDSVSGNEVMALSLDSAEDDIASGTYGDITWRIEKYGKLTVEGTGEFSDSTGKERAPWYDYRERISSATVRVTGMKNASYMFYNCSRLSSLNVSGWDMSGVTDMSGMFSGCGVLSSLDVSGWDTSSVTSMREMFSGCHDYYLRGLDVSGWDTSSVTDMSGMFDGYIFVSSYEYRTKLDVSAWDTSSVTDMSRMFSGCYNMWSLDLSNWDTSSVTDMSGMFSGCYDMRGLSVSGWDTSSVTSMREMFADCPELDYLDSTLDLRGWDTSSVTDMSGMFSGCGRLSRLNVSGWDTSNVTDMSGMFSGCGSNYFAETELNVSGWDTSSVTDMSCMFSGCAYLEKVEVSSWNTSNVTSMEEMFSGCGWLERLDMSGWDTSNVTSMRGMFEGCANLGHNDNIFDLGKLDTSSVTDMSRMFSGCGGLWGFDMSWFDTSNVTDMSYMFSDSNSLDNLDVSGWDTSSVTSMRGMFSGSSSFRWSSTKNLDASGWDTSSVTDMSDMFSDSDWESLDLSGWDLGSVTSLEKMFHGCGSLKELDLSGWDLGSVTSLEKMFHGCGSLKELDLSGWHGMSRVTSMKEMFSGCTELTSLDLSGLGTSSMTDMSWMFSYCRNLTSLNLSGVDTSSVTDMSYMFYCCSGLTSLDLSEFDTSSVTDMSGMFCLVSLVGEYSALTSLDLSSFDTSSVTNMSSMFFGCNSLPSLDLGSFDTSSVRSMKTMFSGCSGLTSLDLSGFDTSSVTSMYAMFEGCSGLTSLDLSGFDTSSVTSMYVMQMEGMQSMFSGCSSLTSLDLSGFDTSSVKSMSYMFHGCSSLTSLDLSGFDTSSVSDMSGMFSGCNGILLSSLDWSGLDTSSVIDMSYMFSGCSELTNLDLSKLDTSSVRTMKGMFSDCNGVFLSSLDLSGLNTGNVTDMSLMFSNCSGLTSLDLSGLDTSSVRDMSGMFSGCNGTFLSSLDLSGLDTSGVTDMGGMFFGCGELTNLNLSGLDTNSVTNMSSMFSDCSSLTSLDLSGFDTSSVTSMSDMFSGCSGLTSLDLSGFGTSSVTDMSSMFSGCSGLTSLDLSGLDTSSVTVMSWMFSGCSGLTSLALSGFDTGNVTSMSYMFSGCSGLTSLDLSGFDTSNVRHMSYMFSSCSGLTSLDLGGFDIGGVTVMRSMFSGCSGLTSLDLSGFDMSGLDTNSMVSVADMFKNCNSLTTLYTPYNTGYLSTGLPVAESDVWYDSAGTTYTGLPKHLDHSIILMKNTKPDAMQSRLTVRLAKSSYEPGSVVKPEDLTVKYRGTDGKTITLSYKGEDAEASGYTMSAVDMSTPGVKTLTVSYNDGADTLTESVSFTVSVLLTDVMVTLPEGEYIYNGKAYEPVPIVKSADGVTLIRGKDYTVSYTDNFNAGEAKLSVIGRNAYSGTVTKSFTIQRATLETMEINFSELCGEPHERSRDLFNCINKIAPYGGSMDYTIEEVVEHNIVEGGEGSVLSGSPVITGFYGDLEYSTNAGTAGDTVLITVHVKFSMNYNDALVHITVRLTDKTEVSISGITMNKQSIYNGRSVAPKGTVVVRAQDGADTNVTEQVTLSYHYTGTLSDGTAYDSDTAPIHVGSYILRVEVAENDFYEGSVEYPFVIGKAPLTITATGMKLVIGEFDDIPNENMLTYKIAGLRGTHTAQDVFDTLPTVSYGLNGEKIDKSSIALDKAGSYELIPSGAELNQTLGTDYEIRTYKKGTLAIVENGSDDPANPNEPTNPDDPANPDDPTPPDDPKDPELPDDANFRVSAVPDQTYTGSAIKPVVTVYYGSRRLTEKTDYTITYKNNIKVNDASVERTAPTITITGKGDYSGKQTITFVIQPKSIAGEDVTAAELIAAQSSKVQKPVPVLTYQGKKLKNKTDFMVSYPDENKTGAYQTAGTYAVTVIGTGNYTGTKNLNFTITNKTLLAKAKVTVKAKDYTGSAITLNAEDITVKVGGNTLAYGTDYTLSYRNNIQAGKATVIVTGAGENYAGSKEATFQIKGESIAKAQITGIVDKTYTGTAQTQDIQVQLNSKILKAGDDYTISYAKAVNAGTATVTVTGKGGYTGSVKKSFKIAAYDLQTNEGGKLQGVPQNLTTAYTKGGATPILNLTFNGKTLEAKKDYTVTYKNNKKLATASDTKAPTMIIKGKGNFKGTLTIPFSITVSNLETDGNVSIMAPDTAYVDKAGKYMAKPVLTDANGKKLAAGTDYEKNFTYTLVGTDGTENALTVADTVPVGSDVKVTVTGKGNYTGTLSTTYRITKDSFAKAKITVTPQAYTGDAITLNAKDIKVELGGNTLTYGKDYTIVEGSYQNNTKRGTATVTVKGLGDYGGMKTVKFKITAKLFASFLKF